MSVNLLVEVNPPSSIPLDDSSKSSVNFSFGVFNFLKDEEGTIVVEVLS